MPLHLGDGWQTPSTANYWPLRPEPPFAESRAYRLLIRDLRRYVREEIAGRSFLIAGHRGAGKTATVSQAVLHTQNEMIEGSDRGGQSFSRRGRLQRPLEVKLVGESLIAPPPQLGTSKTKSAEPKNGKGAVATSLEPSPAPPAATSDTAQSALVHITIALYRALAKEVELRFAQYARGSSGYRPLEQERREFNQRRLDGGELDELAAQLALDLDGTPEPATLRDYWSRLGALRRGVLWPPFAAVSSDQGLREIVAVATAAQAFQVCSGAISYKMTSQESSARESNVESSVDFKDLANHLGTLAAGAVSGAIVGGATTNPLTGVGTGVLVWLLGSITARWTSSRHRKREQTVDYTFLRDRSIQTLDRDLPLVIARIRDAGLAPVFVIDELDKLKRQEQTVGLLISRLKHLVTDYGFFCFLTDRSYFDVIERKISREAYPTEHTFFGERVLIVNRPEDLFAYIVSLVAPPSAHDPAHPFKAAVFALVTMFRSKLNFIDLSRQMDQLTNPDDSLTSSDQDLQGAGRYRLEATMQLAINQILMDDEVSGRFEWDPAFAQLAVDALYYIARCWQEDSDAPLNIGREALEKGLLARMQPPAEEPETAAPPGDQANVGSPSHTEKGADRGHKGPPENAPKAQPRSIEIPPPDLRELVAMVKRLADYLCNFDELKRAIGGSTKWIEVAGQLYESALFAEIVLVEKARLMRPDGSEVYQFELDELARVKPDAVSHRSTVLTPPPAKAPSKPKRKRESPVGQPSTATAASPKQAPKGPIEALENLLQTAELTMDDLVAASVLPRNLTDGFLSDLRVTLASLADRPGDRDLQDRAANNTLTLWKGLIDAQDNLMAALFLLERVVAHLRLKMPRPEILARMARYFDTRGEPMVIWAGMWLAQPAFRLTGEPESLEALTAHLKEWRKTAQAAADFDVRPDRRKTRWEYWQRQLREFVQSREVRPASVIYLDYALAAANLSPGNLFRISLGDMHQVDWSRAALTALPRNGQPPEGPYWLLFGALAALGFDRDALLRLHRSEPLTPLRPTKSDLAAAAEMIRHAAQRPTGVLHIYPDGPGDTFPVEIPGSRPMLSVGVSELDSFLPALNWLYSSELFDEGRDETD
jgi:hypothetical protein